MTVALIADAHLGGPGGASEPLVQHMEQLAESGCSHMVLMGDLFHVWVGDRRYETPEIASMVDALRGFRARGIRLEYVEGNRDFFLQGGPYEDAFDEIALEIAFEVGGTRYLAVHGDGLNDRDWRYRFWRSLSKSALSRLLVRRVPGPLARNLVHGTEQRLAKTNFKHKTVLPDEVIRRYGEERLAEGYDVLLLGHFHEPKTYDVAGGAVHVVDAWYNRGVIEVVGERGIEDSVGPGSPLP